jgi:primosomal replication protein N
MKRKYLVVVMVAMLLQSFAGSPVAAATKKQTENEAQLLEQVKIKVARLGVGEKSRVTVRFKDGTKLKGYIAQAKDSEFIVRDRKTDAPSVISYRDVARVDSNRGHSTARNVALGTAIGAGSVLTVLGILIATFD